MNWPGSTASVQLRNEATVLAQGNVDGNGNFVLTLPDARTIDSALGLVGKPNTTNGCTSTLQISDPSARLRAFDGFAVSQNGTIIGGVGRAYGLTTLDSARPGDYQVRWTYVDRPLDLTGTYTCPAYKETYDLHFNVGWNMSILEYTTPYTPGRYYEIKKHSGSDASASWGFLPRGQ